MRERLIQKQEKHGDVWKYASLYYLRERLENIFELWKDKRSVFPVSEQLKLLDIMNQASLLYLRIEEGFI